MKFINPFIIGLFVLSLSNLSAQNTSDEYWDYSFVASGYYDNAEYHKAAEAFEILWTKKNDREIAPHRLHAAAANCMIDNEEGVRKNLYKIIPVATKRDMKRVLVNYQIFNKYKETQWWKEMESQLDTRLAALIAHHKNLRIHKKGRDIAYSAIRVNASGDTLANTTVLMKPDGTGWGDEAASAQSQMIFVYESSVQDSLDHIEELEIMVGNRFWNNIDTTGFIENEQEIFWHPIRNNEFYKTEIAPFPTVHLPLPDSIGYTRKTGTTHIMNNWGQYTGTETTCSYEYRGKELKSYSGTGEMECYKFLGTADNSRFGISTLEYFFNEELGFTEMNYKTYDGDSIEFRIVDVKNDKD